MYQVFYSLIIQSYCTYLPQPSSPLERYGRNNIVCPINPPGGMYDMMEGDIASVLRDVRTVHNIASDFNTAREIE